MNDAKVHKFLIMGIIAGVSLTTFLFGITNQDIRDIRDDRDIDTGYIIEIKEDVAYIKGVIETWDELYVVVKP